MRIREISEPEINPEEERELDLRAAQREERLLKEQKHSTRISDKQKRAESVFDTPLDRLDKYNEEQRILLEKETDEIYSQKIQLQTELDAVLPYLPLVQHEVKLDEDKTEIIKRQADWGDIHNWVKQGTLVKKIERQVDRNIPDTQKDRELEIERLKQAINARVCNALNLRDVISKRESEGLVRNYKNFRLRELALAKEKLEDIDATLEKTEKMIDLARTAGDAGNIIVLIEVANKLKKEREEIVFSSPEAYLWNAGQQLQETKRIFDENGKIVETAHVKETIQHVLDELNSRPAFIHGELSTGKTELAKHIAREYLSAPYLATWEAENPKPENSKDLQDWEERREKAKEPLEVRGARGLEQGDVTSHTALERTKSPEPEEQIRIINEAFEKYKETVLADALKNIDNPKEKEKIEEREYEALARGYREDWKKGIITMEKLSPIFEAMENGRTVIIDEMNAIPHHVLIVLNDVINKKPGEKVVTPQGRVFEVKPGFNVICTGNWKPGDDGKRYLGRPDIDAAYISRLGVVRYDYLPNSINTNEGGTLESQRKSRQENELFKMMMVRLIDNNLGASLPEGSIRKIKELARISRILQDAYSDKLIEKSFWPRRGKFNPKDVLKENVPAYRQLIPILESWKKDGFVRPLDDYIFLKYVTRSSARPEEMKYIYNILQTVGDFFQGGDWPTSAGDAEADKMPILNYPIIRKMYGVDKLSMAKKAITITEAPMRYYSPIEIIEEIYGKPDPRKRISLKVFEREKTEEEINEEKRYSLILLYFSLQAF